MAKGFRGQLSSSLGLKPEEEVIPVNEVNANKPEKPVLPVSTSKPVKEEKPETSTKLTVEVRKELYDMLEREAFWEHLSMKKMVDEILTERYKGRDLKPIPEHKRPTKRGPAKGTNRK
jgi:predicted HicB family RNase H-like nuclease